MRFLILVLLLLFTYSPAYAKHKPICAFSSNGSPAEMQCGSIGDISSNQVIEDALAKSRSTGFLWILQMGDHDNPLTPADQIARRNLRKFEKLLPYIVAVTYGQEWYEQAEANVYARYGLSSNNPNKKDLIFAWISLQHFRIKQVTSLPIIWLTTAVFWNQPVPFGTDIVAIDAYIADGESTAWAETVLLYAETQTNLPLVVIPRWFRYTGPKQGEGWFTMSIEPTKEMVDLYFKILRRARYIAMWGFVWESRPTSDIVGLKDMPEIRDYFLKKLKEQ